jgi:BRCT domain type II-containing protein
MSRSVCIRNAPEFARVKTLEYTRADLEQKNLTAKSANYAKVRKDVSMKAESFSAGEAKNLGGVVVVFSIAVESRRDPSADLIRMTPGKICAGRVTCRVSNPPYKRYKDNS